MDPTRDFADRQIAVRDDGAASPLRGAEEEQWKTPRIAKMLREKASSGDGDRSATLGRDALHETIVHATAPVGMSKTVPLPASHGLHYWGESHRKEDSSLKAAVCSSKAAVSSSKAAVSPSKASVTSSTAAASSSKAAVGKRSQTVAAIDLSKASLVVAADAHSVAVTDPATPRSPQPLAVSPQVPEVHSPDRYDTLAHPSVSYAEESAPPSSQRSSYRSSDDAPRRERARVPKSPSSERRSRSRHCRSSRSRDYSVSMSESESGRHSRYARGRRRRRRDENKLVIELRHSVPDRPPRQRRRRRHRKHRHRSRHRRRNDSTSESSDAYDYSSASSSVSESDSYSSDSCESGSSRERRSRKKSKSRKHRSKRNRKRSKRARSRANEKARSEGAANPKEEVPEGPEAEYLKGGRTSAEVTEAAGRVQKLFRGYAVRKDIHLNTDAHAFRQAPNVVDDILADVISDAYVEELVTQALGRHNLINIVYGPSEKEERLAQRNDPAAFTAYDLCIATKRILFETVEEDFKEITKLAIREEVNDYLNKVKNSERKDPRQLASETVLDDVLKEMVSDLTNEAILEMVDEYMMWTRTEKIAKALLEEVVQVECVRIAGEELAEARINGVWETILSEVLASESDMLTHEAVPHIADEEERQRVQRERDAIEAAMMDQFCASMLLEILSTSFRYKLNSAGVTQGLDEFLHEHMCDRLFGVLQQSDDVRRMLSDGGFYGMLLKEMQARASTSALLHMTMSSMDAYTALVEEEDEQAL